MPQHSAGNGEARVSSKRKPHTKTADQERRKIKREQKEQKLREDIEDAINELTKRLEDIYDEKYPHPIAGHPHTEMSDATWFDLVAEGRAVQKRIVTLRQALLNTNQA